MKLAMAQMSMMKSIDENLKKSLDFCDKAKEENADLLFFPEIQCTPFFPQYEKQDVQDYRMKADGIEIQKLKEKARMHQMYLSPNLYLEEGRHCYDASFWINPDGRLEGISKMVHIAQAEQFYEQDYYTPSDSGFQVFDTEFGKIGIVICYDRHLPESIRICTLMGADLIIVPTANCKAEPLEMFEWEMRVQAMQNQVFIAMCNRVGKEGDMDFAGESLVIAPTGDVIKKADDREQLVVCEVDLKEAGRLKEDKPYLKSRQPKWYEELTKNN